MAGSARQRVAPERHDSQVLVCRATTHSMEMNLTLEHCVGDVQLHMLRQLMMLSMPRARSDCAHTA